MTEAFFEKINPDLWARVEELRVSIAGRDKLVDVEEGRMIEMIDEDVDEEGAQQILTYAEALSRLAQQSEEFFWVSSMIRADVPDEVVLKVWDLKNSLGDKAREEQPQPLNTTILAIHPQEN